MGDERAGRRHITIAGAGAGGICAGIKLKQAGFEDFVILERSASIGGTWASNRYPGLCCDTPSLLYSFTFEQKLDWTRTCARQPEIRQYMQHCVDKYELAPHIRFNAEVREARRVFAEHHWPVIDVTRRSIEETASSVHKLLMRRNGGDG